MSGDVTTSSTRKTSERRAAGHYEVLGETYAKFEFFENGWNPYSRFLDVDKVDLILRKKNSQAPSYREIQVKFGKLYECSIKWEKKHFDITSWRFFQRDEFARYVGRADFFVAYVLAREIGYERDIFVFPVDVFHKLIQNSIPSGEKRKMYLSRLKGTKDKWIMRTRSGPMSEVDDSNSIDVSRYHRNFALLDSEGSH